MFQTGRAQTTEKQEKTKVESSQDLIKSYNAENQKLHTYNCPQMHVNSYAIVYTLIVTFHVPLFLINTQVMFKNMLTFFLIFPSLKGD